MSEILYSMRPGGGRRRRHRLARAFSWTLILLGVLVLIDVAVTLIWQEPLSAIYASVQQEGLKGQLSRIESTGPSLAELEHLQRLRDEHRRVLLLARKMERDAPLDSAVGEIDIPRIGAKFVLVNGTGTEELEKGPGIYSKAEFPSVTFPGVPGTTAIAGHRTTWLEPFRRIGEMHKGEQIIVTMPYARFVYRMTGRKVVKPTNISAAVTVTRHTRLVLSACTPLFSAEYRMLVFARLIRTRPRGAALIRRPLPGRLDPLGAPATRLPALLRTRGSARRGARRAAAGNARANRRAGRRTAPGSARAARGSARAARGSAAPAHRGSAARGADRAGRRPARSRHRPAAPTSGARSLPGEP